MDTGVVAAHDREGFQKIASHWHTALVIGVQAGLSLRGYLRSDQLRAAAHPDRITLYQHTMFNEWIVFALIIVGLRSYGTSIYAVLGQRWQNIQQFAIDIGIGFLILVGTILVPAIFGPSTQTQADPATHFLLPQNGMERAWWIALSLTAGICEEVLFRGYLQKQFTSFTRNVPAGILLSAVMFGAAHGYQGLWKAVLIGSSGAIAGTAAYWRKSVRPGMFAHALQDLIGGLMRHS